MFEIVSKIVLRRIFDIVSNNVFEGSGQILFSPEQDVHRTEEGERQGLG